MGIALQTGWSRAELLEMSPQEILSWAECVGELRGVKRAAQSDAPATEPGEIELTPAEKRALALAGGA